MLGFEIIMNDEEHAVSVSSNRGLISAISSIVDDDARFTISGLLDFEHITWLDRTLIKGDRIAIRVAEIDQNSNPIKSHLQNREELIKHYHSLKSELDNRGLL